MKRIIEIPDKVVEAIQNGEDYRYDIHTAIAQSKPYDDSGDLISREALKKELEAYRHTRNYKSDEDEAQNSLLDNILEDIDNAQAIPLPSEQIAWEQGYEAGLAQGKQDRPKGEWISGRINSGDGMYCKCSICNFVDYSSSRANTCPHCKSPMKGGSIT